MKQYGSFSGKHIALKGLLIFGAVLFSTRLAFANIDNVNPNSGSMCQSEIMIPMPAAKHYALTGEVKPGVSVRHSRAWYAAKFGDVSILDKLVTRNTRLLTDNHLLMLAASLENSDVLADLLSRGANPNAVIASDGTTLLDIATSCERPVNMMYLLNLGANVYAKTKDGGATAMAITFQTGGHLTFTLGIMLLLSAGYNPLCYITSNKLTAYSLYDGMLYMKGTRKADRDLEKIPKYERLQVTKLLNLVHMLKNLEVIHKRLGQGYHSCTGKP